MIEVDTCVSVYLDDIATEDLLNELKSRKGDRIPPDMIFDSLLAEGCPREALEPIEEWLDARVVTAAEWFKWERWVKGDFT